jgi:hypothetical protein
MGYYFSEGVMARSSRDLNEINLVELLAQNGFPIQLSSDNEDLHFGIDAWDTELDLPIDIYIGSGGLHLKQKLVSAEQKRVAVFAVKRKTFLRIWSDEDFKPYLNQILGLYRTFRQKHREHGYISKAEVQAQMLERIREVHKKNRAPAGLQRHALNKMKRRRKTK